MRTAASAAALLMVLSGCSAVASPPAPSAFIPWELAGEQVVRIAGQAEHVRGSDDRILLRVATSGETAGDAEQTWFEGTLETGTADAAAPAEISTLPAATETVLPRAAGGTFQLEAAGAKTTLVQRIDGFQPQELAALDGSVVEAGTFDGQPAWAAYPSATPAPDGGTGDRSFWRVQVLTDTGPVTLSAQPDTMASVAEPLRPVAGMPADQLQLPADFQLAFDPENRTWALAGAEDVTVVEDGSVTRVVGIADGSEVRDLAVCGDDVYAVLALSEPVTVPLDTAEQAVLDDLGPGRHADQVSALLDERSTAGYEPIAPQATSVACTDGAVLTVVQGDASFGVLRTEAEQQS